MTTFQVILQAALHGAPSHTTRDIVEADSCDDAERIAIDQLVDTHLGRQVGVRVRWAPRRSGETLNTWGAWVPVPNADDATTAAVRGHHPSGGGAQAITQELQPVVFGGSTELSRETQPAPWRIGSP